MRAMADLRALSNSVCVVGVDESDEIGSLPHKSQLTLHLEAVTNAVRDTGLKIADCAHCPPLEKPAEFLAAVEAFLDADE